MKSKLPDEQRDGVEEYLWAKSGGFCFLCEAHLNRASDDIVADHDVPEAAGGATDTDNLNLAHAHCNKAKRDAKTVPIRPYLKLSAFANKRRLKYDGYLEHFGISPSPVVMAREADVLTVELPDGTTTLSQVFEEKTANDIYEYAFVQLPRNAIYNDEACQPRAIRPDHAWSIYSDLQRNPLHEPPSCRAEAYATGVQVRLLMFDGQHKTVASWMLGRESVTAKVYLNLSTARANELVNSIQAKIKKLPLSPFELAGKMSDEWESKFQEYEAAVGSSQISEKGFLDWLPTSEKTRGKQALAAALVQTILSAEDLSIRKYVKKVSGATEPFEITEQALKARLIEAMLVREPQKLQGEAAQGIRDREAANIVMCLNLLSDMALDLQEGSSDRTPQELERGRRMTYQASLGYIASLVRHLWFHIAVRPEPKALMTDEFSDAQLLALRTGIERLVAHPAWTATWVDKPEMGELKIALEKNQEAPAKFEKLGLTLSYLLIGANEPTFKAHWHTAPS